MTGSKIVRHRDMYQKLFTTMIDYLNMGLGQTFDADSAPGGSLKGITGIR